MMSLDALEGCAKKPYKNKLFLSTLLLDAEETEKRRRKKAKKKVTSIFGGPWKWAGSSSTIFFQRIGFFKILKNP